MQQHQRREVQDWLNLFEQQKQRDSLRWSFVVSSRLTFKLVVTSAVIFGFSEKLVDSFTLNAKSRKKVL